MLTPKYWMVCLAGGETPLLSSADKNRQHAIDKWFYSSPARMVLDDEPNQHMLDSGLDCKLFEVKQCQN